MKTRLLTALLTLCLVLSLTPISATTVFADSTVTVKNETDLKAALNNADCTEIKLGSNIETTVRLNVERTVTLDLNGYTLSCSSTDEDIFRISSSGNLTVKDSGTNGKIDGQNKNCGFNVKGGTLTLEGGSIVKCTDTGGDGGAVDVSNTGVTETPIKYGKFVMNGGAIIDCKADDDGGAVDIGSGCIFIMNGGTIGNCRADDDGGAVFIKQNGRFTMTGGSFEDCGTSPYSFDARTVTFDSDGGSAVSEQKLLNAPAVKPADPKKSGYEFAEWYLGEEQYTFTANVTSNITLKAHWTKTAGSKETIAIDVVEINDVTVSFKDGDKPVFTGKVPDGANYAYRCEWWELTSKTGAMSTDFGNFYENKINTFEAGKTYHYGVYVTTYGDVGNVTYIFGPDTKLKINGKFVNYKRYEGDTSDGSDGTMWVLTDLTMTPEAGGTTPDGNKPGTGETTGTKTGDTSNMALWIALLFVSGGAAIGTTVVKRKKKCNR